MFNIARGDILMSLSFILTIVYYWLWWAKEKVARKHGALGSFARHAGKQSIYHIDWTSPSVTEGFRADSRRSVRPLNILLATLCALLIFAAIV